MEGKGRERKKREGTRRAFRLSFSYESVSGTNSSGGTEGV